MIIIDKIVAATFGFMLVAGQTSASSMICKSESSWLKKWYDLEFVQLDLNAPSARLGSKASWLQKKPASVQKIAIGSKYLWRQSLTVINTSQEYTFDFTLRVKESGEADLFMRNRQGRTWEIPMSCK